MSTILEKVLPRVKFSSADIKSLVLDDEEFKEEEHPRDKTGKFTAGAGSKKGNITLRQNIVQGKTEEIAARIALKPDVIKKMQEIVAKFPDDKGEVMQKYKKILAALPKPLRQNEAPKGHLTGELKGFVGGTKVREAKNAVGGLKNKSYVIHAKVSTNAAGIKFVSYVHQFNSEKAASENLDALKKMYESAGYAGAAVDIKQVRSHVIVSVKLQPKAGYDPSEKSSEPRKQRSSHERVQHISTAKPKKVDRLGGGVSDTRKVIFEDGSKGVFKSSKGEPKEQMRFNISLGHQTAREVGAWEVAKLVGMDDLVTPCVKRNINGEEGALLDWQEGNVAYNADYNKRFDGDKDLARAAVFDYVIGNTDRHGGNWLVDESSGEPKLRLIDHGLSFPDLGSYEVGGNTAFIDHARFEDKFRPSDLAKEYVAKKDEIMLSLDRLGLPARAIVEVSDRIDILENCKEWRDL